MNDVLAGYAVFVAGARYVLFWLAVLAAVIAVVDWAVRTRRLSPFGAVGRFSRRVFDPLIRPVERRIVRSGGLPSNAPWWTLGIVVVGGLLLISLLDLLGGFLRQVLWGLSSPDRLLVLVLGLAFGILKIALVVRVLSSWIRVSPYSRWIRWSWTLTEWMLAPLRRLIPPFGAIDITPIVAWLLIVVVQRVVYGAVAGLFARQGFGLP